MIRFLFITIVALFTCSCNYKDKKYSIYDFKTFSVKDSLSIMYSSPDEKSAINIAGSYIYATFAEKRFPTDYKKWGILTNFLPFCVQLHEIDSVFIFCNFLQGAFHRPSQIDMVFTNGHILRFCFSGIVFDPDKIDCEYCPEHPHDIAKYNNDNCR